LCPCLSDRTIAGACAFSGVTTYGSFMKPGFSSFLFDSGFCPERSPVCLGTPSVIFPPVLMSGF